MLFQESLRTTFPYTDWLPLPLLSIHAALLVFSAHCHSPVWDETVRIQAGCIHWQTGDISRNPGNPPFNDLIASAPIMLFANVNERDDFTRRFLNSSHVVRFVFLGRLALIPFSVLGGWICFAWARDLFGRTAGLLALLLWCFDPLILAHGSLITGDMFSTVAGVGAAYSFWKWMQRPCMSGAVVCGITLGIALLSKYVWVIMPLLWLTLWMARRFSAPRPAQWPLARQMVVMVLMSLYVVNAGYGLGGSFQPLGGFKLTSETLKPFAFWQDVHATSGLGRWMRQIPVPLPRNYIMGIDQIANHVQILPMRTYVHGEFVAGHVWYFYLYGLLVKMPLGTWTLLAVSCYAKITAHDGRPRSSHNDLALWLPALTVLCFASWVTSYKFLRYILPMVPFVFIWMGDVAVWAKEGGLWRNCVVWGALGWSVVSSLAVYPHSLSYFNEAAGGTRNGHAHLLGPSYDYGQDFFFLKDWIESHPEAEPLYVECNNWVDPKIAGIQSTRRMPRFGPEAGWYVLSTNVLRGSLRLQYPVESTARSEFQYLESFLEETPVASAGYSIRIYHLECWKANAMRARLGLEAIECDGAK